MGVHFDLAKLSQRVSELDKLQEAEDFWNDTKKAQTIIKEANIDRNLLSTYDKNKKTLDDLGASIDELSKDYDEDLMALVEDDYDSAMKQFSDFEMQVLLSNDYDHANAILEIHPGAGGTESQDWALMLFRMYQRYAQKNGYGFEVLDYEDGDEAGLKSCSVLIKGDLAYGYLKGESGVHRLVRISPFDANSRSHTSFASVEVTPEFNDEIDITIDDKDLEVDTMRSSGAGGQHINKTDSAVRIVHTPTGITVNCQDGRNQLANKETALRIIKARVYNFYKEQKEKEAGEARKSKIGTGDRSEKIRTYNYPQNRVTDHRIGLTINQLDRIMEGKLDDIVNALIKNEEQEKLLNEQL